MAEGIRAIKFKMINNAKDLADSIVGSHIVLQDFLSIYEEFQINRVQSMTLLNEIRTTIIDNSYSSQRIENVISNIHTVTNNAAMIPNAMLSWTAQIISVISRVVGSIFGQGFSKSDIDKEKVSMKQLFQKDINICSLSYVHAVQCQSQFEETRSVIRNLHAEINRENVDTSLDDKNVVEFLNYISEYNPSSERIFYRKLRLGLEKLLKNSNSVESRAFTRVLEDVPEAVEVINLLPWRFNTDCFDDSIVQDSWKELFAVLDNDESTAQQFLSAIQNCLCFLEKEVDNFKRSVSVLLKEKI